MVTVFIRLVIGCLDYICFHVLNVLFACVFSNTDCFLVGVQIKVIATSDLWLFIHASKLLPSTPHPNSPTLVSDFIFIYFFLLQSLSRGFGSIRCPPCRRQSRCQTAGRRTPARCRRRSDDVRTTTGVALRGGITSSSSASACFPSSFFFILSLSLLLFSTCLGASARTCRRARQERIISDKDVTSG